MKRISKNHEYASNPPICKYFARGYCARGSNCFYSHVYLPYGGFGLNSVFAQSFHVNESLIPTLDFDKTCEDYDQGHCSKGPLCPFKHVCLSPEEVWNKSSVDIGIGAHNVGRRLFGQGNRTIGVQ